jgi:hypothetical protein
MNRYPALDDRRSAEFRALLIAPFELYLGPSSVLVSIPRNRVSDVRFIIERLALEVGAEVFDPQ